MSVLAEALDRDGFAIVRGAFDDRDLDPVRGEFAELARRRLEEGRSGVMPERHPAWDTDVREVLRALALEPDFDEGQMLAALDVTLPHQPGATITEDSPFHVGPALLGLVTSPGLLEVLAEVLGPDVTLSPNGHVRFKLVASGRRTITPWHRDDMTHAEASDGTTVVTCWIPMDDVTEANGCLTVLPGGHRSAIDISWPLDPDVVDELERNARPLPMRRGDLLMMDKHLPHASLPNTSPVVRWSFDLRFHPSAEPTDRPWFPSLEVLRDGAPLPRDPDTWHQAWAEVRSRFARTGEKVPGRATYAQALRAQRGE